MSNYSHIYIIRNIVNVVIFVLLFNINILHAVIIENIEDTATPEEVYVEGKPIVTSEASNASKVQKAIDLIPPSLNKSKIITALSNRSKIVPPIYAPHLGPSKAPLKIVELADLSCIQCYKTLNAVDEVRKKEKYKNKIRFTYMYFPLDIYNITNPSALYAKLAHNKNVFWQYRKSIISLTELSDSILIDKLLNSGITIREVRNAIRLNGRRFYKELDEETLMAKDLGLTLPPVYFVNGIQVGSSIKIEQLEDLLDYELELSKLD